MVVCLAAKINNDLKTFTSILNKELYNSNNKEALILL
jgi:hypothetical protein